MVAPAGTPRTIVKKLQAEMARALQLPDVLALLRDGTASYPTNMHTLGMAIGYELSGDERFLHAGMLCLEQYLDSGAITSGPNETKPIAMKYRGLVRFLHHAHRQGLLEKIEYAFAKPV